MLEVSGQAGAIAEPTKENDEFRVTRRQVADAVRCAVLDWFENKEGDSIYCDSVTAEAVALDVLSILSKKNG
jgi:hypothetical protein